MTPQESALLQSFLSDLVAAGQIPKDPQAAALIEQAGREQADALYLVVQRSLIQQQALDVAQRRIAELERAAARPAPAAEAPSSFLSGLGWGRSNRAAAPQPTGPAAVAAGNAGAASGFGSGARPGAMQAAAPGAAAARGGSFLGQAAAMAAGVAGGAFLFQGIQNLMGHGAGEAEALGPQTENLTVNEFNEAPASDGAQPSADGDWDSTNNAGADYSNHDDGGFDGGGFDGGDDFA